MKRFGYSMLILGFLSGAFATSLDVGEVTWMLFVPAAFIATSGLLIIKRSEKSAAQAAHVLTANRDVLESSLTQIIEQVDTIRTRRADGAISTDDLRGEIDERLRDHFRDFVDVRESLVHLYGVQTYADIMSDFAAGERHMNRVWSASTDGYGDEADRYVDRAAVSFQAALERLRQFTNSG